MLACSSAMRGVFVRILDFAQRCDPAAQMTPVEWPSPANNFGWPTNGHNNSQSLSASSNGDSKAAKPTNPSSNASLASANASVSSPNANVYHPQSYRHVASAHTQVVSPVASTQPSSTPGNIGQFAASTSQSQTHSSSPSGVQSQAQSQSQQHARAFMAIHAA